MSGEGGGREEDGGKVLSFSSLGTVQGRIELGKGTEPHRSE